MNSTRLTHALANRATLLTETASVHVRTNV